MYTPGIPEIRRICILAGILEIRENAYTPGIP